METQRGWTLIELVIVLTVCAILASISLSALGGGLEAARAADARAALTASLVLAVNHSTNAGSRAVLCPSADATSCLDSPDWSQGWLVFLDPNANRELDGGEAIIKRQPRLAGKARLHSTAGRTRIVFQASGSNAGSNVTWTLCDGRGPSRAVALVMNNSGRFREDKPTPQSAAETCAP